MLGYCVMLTMITILQQKPLQEHRLDRCKLDEMIKKEMKFRYLGIEILGYGDLETEIRHQHKY